jgi:hypothetical protein
MESKTKVGIALLAVLSLLTLAVASGGTGCSAGANHQTGMRMNWIFTANITEEIAIEEWVNFTRADYKTECWGICPSDVIVNKTRDQIIKVLLDIIGNV